MNFSKWAKWAVPVAGFVIFGVAIHFIAGFLQEHSYVELRESVSAIPLSQLLAAIGVTILAYGILSLYDMVAFYHFKIPLERWKILFGSFTAFSFSNSIGLANLAGSSVRMRIYASFGVAPMRILQVIAFVSTSFWLGFFALAGVTFVVAGLDLPESFHLSPSLMRGIGLVFILLVLGYLSLSFQAQKTIRIRSFEFEIPNFTVSAVQIAVAMVDWVLAGLVLYVLLPNETSISFGLFLSIFLAAQVVALLTHVPGGLGILEAIVIYFVAPTHEPTPHILVALLSYRVIYYFLPLAVAGVGLGTYEIYVRKHHIGNLSRRTFGWVKPLAPAVAGVFVFLSGAILLFSGTTPSIRERADILKEILPLPVIELSHFFGSCLGVVLLIVSLSLFNKNHGAWFIAMGGLIAGAVFSVLKGLDYEEATLLAAFAGFLYAARSEFYRPAKLVRDRWTPGWFVAMIMVMGSSIYLGFFAYRHVEYSNELWWRFRYHADAPRFLRATAGTLLTAITIGLVRLLAAPEKLKRRASVPVEQLLPVVREAKDTMANLALLGDKQIFASPDGKTFLMYAVQGRTWVVLGDPVGVEENIEDLIYDFRKLVDQMGGQLVFYQIRPDFLPSYIDLGMMFLKLGEEAHIPLAKFSLEGRSQKGMRQPFNKLQKMGVQFRVVPPASFDSIAPDLKRISDAWLAEKDQAEKGFSLGYYDETYLRRFSTAVLELDGKIQAFANLWEGGGLEELSIDLMRYDPAGPAGMMEHLTIEILLWGKTLGYRYFNLGMAPLSGLETGKLGSRWNRAGELLFRHAERFYNFQGLRRYKDKFDPEWEPRFLAYSSKLSLPIVLKDLTVLISGGVKGVVSR